MIEEHCRRLCYRLCTYILRNVTAAHKVRFSYAGPSTWNALSEDLRAVAEPTEFRKQQKLHFFHCIFLMFTDISSFHFSVLLWTTVMHLCCSFCNAWCTINLHDMIYDESATVLPFPPSFLPLPPTLLPMPNTPYSSFPFSTPPG